MKTIQISELRKPVDEVIPDSSVEADSPESPMFLLRNDQQFPLGQILSKKRVASCGGGTIITHNPTDI